MKRNFWTNLAVFASALTLAGIPAAAQGPGPHPPGVSLQQGGPGGPRPLARLAHALEEAGAPALTEAQQEQLRSLIQGLLEQRRAEGPDPSFRDTHRAYRDAILSGDLAGAQSQADLLGSQMASRTTHQLKAQAEFMIQALGVLNNDQVGALLAHFGTSGLFGLLNSIAGPGGHRGPGGFRPPRH